MTRCRIDEIEQGIGFIGAYFIWVCVVKMWVIKFICFADSSYVQFFGDDFLRTLILRFVFCDVVLRLHRGFRGRHMRPRCEPPLPSNELLEHPSLSHIIFQLASALDVRGHFSDGPECDWWFFSNTCKNIYYLNLLVKQTIVINSTAIARQTRKLAKVNSGNSNIIRSDHKIASKRNKFNYYDIYYNKIIVIFYEIFITIYIYFFLSIGSIATFLQHTYLGAYKHVCKKNN